MNWFGVVFIDMDSACHWSWAKPCSSFNSFTCKTDVFLLCAEVNKNLAVICFKWTQTWLSEMFCIYFSQQNVQKYNAHRKISIIKIASCTKQRSSMCWSANGKSKFREVWLLRNTTTIFSFVETETGMFISNFLIITVLFTVRDPEEQHHKHIFVLINYRCCSIWLGRHW